MIRRIQMIEVATNNVLSEAERKEIIDGLETRKFMSICHVINHDETSDEKTSVKLRRQKSSDQQTCAICIADYNNNDVLRILPCGHNFHQECIDQWLNQSLLCPFCKRDIRTKEEITRAIRYWAFLPSLLWVAGFLSFLSFWAGDAGAEDWH